MAVGGLLPQSGPIVCGGNDKRNYCVNPKNPKKKLVTTKKRRHEAASLVMDDGSLWISGGYDQTEKKNMKSTEFVKPGVASKYGPILPIALKVCAILIKILDATVSPF